MNATFKGNLQNRMIRSNFVPSVAHSHARRQLTALSSFRLNDYRQNHFADFFFGGFIERNRHRLRLFRKE